MKKYLNVLCAVVALAFTAACSHQEMDIEDVFQNEQVRIVPFSASVITAVETRATLVDNGHNGYEYRLQDDDRLYIWSNDEKIYGELSRVSGSDRSFSGYVTLEAGSELNNGTTLNAVIKSSQDRILGSLTEFKENNFEPNYTSAIAASEVEAVQMFSYFKTSGTYYTGMGVVFYFNGSQNSTFLSFDITLEDGTAAEKSVVVSISNDGSVVRTGSVTTKEEGGAIHAKFVAGFPSDTTLIGATVTVGESTPISFGGSTTLLSNTFYKVIKTYPIYKVTASGSLFSIPFSVTKENIKSHSTLGEIIGDKFTSITDISFSGSSIEFGAVNTEDWKATTVTIKGTGVTDIKVTGSVGPVDVTEVPVELNVAR